MPPATLFLPPAAQIRYVQRRYPLCGLLFGPTHWVGRSQPWTLWTPSYGNIQRGSDFMDSLCDSNLVALWRACHWHWNRSLTFNLVFFPQGV